MQWIKRIFGAAERRQAGPRSSHSPLILALEPRMMFDGAALATAAEAAKPEPAPTGDAAGADSHADAQHDNATAAPPAAATADQRHEVVFVDNNVADYQQLVADAKPGKEVVVLDASRNGLQQMADYLRGREGIDAIHVISHGQAGEVRFGSLVLSEANLSSYQSLLGELGHSLAADGDLLLYGCDIGEGAAGSAFVKALASATGADVGASNDPTGSLALGGDWTLETRSGSLEAAPLFAQGQAADWNHLLAYKAFPTDKTYSESAQGQDVDAYTTNAEGNRDLFLLNQSGTYTFSGHVESGGPNDGTDVIPIELPQGAYIDSYTLSINNVLISSGTSFTLTSLSDPTFFRQTSMISQTVTNDVPSGLYSFYIGNGTVVADYVLTLNVVIPNNAPTLLDKSPALTSELSTSTEFPSAGSGTLVSQLIGSSGIGNFSDADAGTTAGMAITATDNSQGGVWWYSTDGRTSWSTMGAVSNSSALLLKADAGTYVYFQASNSGWSGTLNSAITFRAWDQTSGAVGSKADTSANGGTTAFSSATDSASLQLVAPNAAPVVTTDAGSASFVEKGGAVVIDSGLTVTDSDSANLSGATVRITSGFQAGDALGFVNDGTHMGNITGTYDAATGTLTLSSVGGANVAQWQAALRAVTYGNASDAPSSTSRTVTFKVNDGSSDSVAATRSVTVTAVNDAPVIAVGSQAIQVREDTSVALNGISFSDADAGSGSVTVTFSVPQGSFSAISGGGVTVGGIGTFLSLTGSIANINAFLGGSNLHYTPAANDTGDKLVSITISDNGNTGSDGAKSASASFTVHVEPVNDAPQITGPATYSLDEDTSLSLSGISFSDVDAGSGTMTVTFSVSSGVLVAMGGAGVTAISTGIGQLTLSGSLADLNAFMAGNNLTYTPVANFNGSVQLTVGINDNGNGGSGPADALSSVKHVDLTINAVNDPPTISVPGAQNVSSDGSLTFSSANGNAIVVGDVDNADSGFTLSVSVSHGSVLYAGIPAQTWFHRGFLSDLNAILNGLVYQPTSGYQGSDTLVLQLTDSSGGTTSISVALQVITPSPQVQDVAALSPNGAYKVGDTIQLQVTFDQNVFVDGTPGLLLETGLFDRVASYSAGSGGKVLTFLYTVREGDVSADLDFASTSALQLNGATIKNAGGDSAILTLAAPGSAHSLGANANIVVDGVAPSIGSVSVPADGTYRAGQSLDFTLHLSEAATVDGVPRLAVDIGGQTYYADYLSGTGSSALVFRLSVPSGQQDSNGISLGSVDLNGGGIRDSVGNALQTTLNNVGVTSGVLVDSIAPSVSGIVRVDASPSNASSVRYTVTFSEAVSGVDVGDFVVVGSQTANGIVTSITTLDSRTYSVLVSAVSGTGTLRLDLANDSSIRDQAGNALASGLQGETYAVDRDAPQVSLVFAPGDGTYKVGDMLVFSILTNEPVQVGTQGGTPRLAFVMGSETVYADYVVGSGTNQLEFYYAIKAGDNDADGITITSLQTNGGSLKDSAGNDALLTLNNILYSPNMRVDTQAPVVSSVGVPADGTYKAGDLLSFTVEASETVTVNGSPRLALTIGSSTVYADYVSGSGTSTLVFRYQVQAGDNDADGITVGALAANGGTLRDSAGNNAVLTLNSVGATTGVLVDTTAPSVSSVSVPANGDYNAGDVLSFTVNASEAVFVNGSPRLALTIGSSTVYADYVSGSGTGALLFQYQVQSGDTDADGIVVAGLQSNGATLRDSAGNDANLTLNGVGATTGVLVDTTAPSVSSVSVPANGDYNAGDVLSFTVNASEAVVVNGSPRLALTIGSSTVYADYVSGSGTGALLFQYQVQAGDTDADGISVVGLQSNGATLRDVAGNDADLTLNSVGATTGVLVDTTAPSVSSVSVPANGDYNAGDVLSFTVNASEAVFVNGTPRLALDIGGRTVYADYASGSGTGALVFQYTVQPGDTDANGISIVGLLTNGGSLRDSAGNDSDLTLNGVGNTVDVLVDTTAPVVGSVYVPLSGYYNAGDVLSFTVNASEAVFVNGSPRLALTIGSSTVYADYVSGSGSGTLVFQYQVQAGDTDADGIVVTGLQSNGATLRDKAGNDANLTLNNVDSTSGLFVDTTAPHVASVSVPSNGYYNAGDVLSFTVNASEAVYVNGSPRLALTIGSSTVYADYASGSGTGTLVFQYQVQAGDTDANGIAVVGLQGNGATLCDIAGNDANLALNNIGSTAGVRVDTTEPVVASVGVPAAGDYNAGDVLSFTVNASEAVFVNGSPRLALTIGSSTVYADYVSGSGSDALVFQYQVQAGDTDADGISIVGLQGNGATLRDIAGNDANLTLNSVGATSGVRVDTTAPVVASVNVPAAGDYNAGDVLSFTVNASEAVLVGGTPRLALDVGGRTVYADYVSGSGSTALVFQYQVQSGDNDADGISVVGLQGNGGSLRDSAGNDADLTLLNVGGSGDVRVDTTAPVATAIVRVDGSPSNAGSLAFDVSFSEPVDGLDAASFALQASGSATGRILGVVRIDAQTWRVSVGNVGGDGNLALVLRADARVQDAAGNALARSLQGPAYALDHSSPQVSAVQLPADGRYTPGQTLEFSVDYSEAVQVDTRGGVPRIAITLDRGGVVYADYVSGSGSSRLVFAYTVQSGQADIDGIQLGDQILANGARLSDSVGNAASLALGSLPSSRGLLVQGNVSDGDPQFRSEDGIAPPAPAGGGVAAGGAPALFGAPASLGQAPLLDSRNGGAGQSLLGSLFHSGPSQSQLALVFSGAASSGFGDGSGSGFLGFGGGDAGVFGTSTLGAIFGAARAGDEQALSAFGPRQGDLGQGLRGIFTSSGLGQQLQEMNQREQRQVADLANAFGELGQERPAS